MRLAVGNGLSQCSAKARGCQLCEAESAAAPETNARATTVCVGGDLWYNDVECAILDGEITKTEMDDPRGPRYTIVGLAEDGRREVGVVGRFTETGIYLIITAYEVTEREN